MNKIDQPITNACTVSGTLGFVLRVSQIFGVVPLRFKWERDGWRIRVSRVASLYGKAVISLMFLLSVIVITNDLYLDREKAYHSRSSSNVVVSAISIGSISVTLYVQAFSGVVRLNNLITCMAQIQQINAVLSEFAPPKSFKIKGRILAVWSLIAGLLIIIVDYSLFVYEIVLRDGDLFVEGWYVGFYVEIYMLKVLILQVTLILTNVLYSFIHLNDCLKILLQQIHKETLHPRILTIKANSFLDPNRNISYKYISNVIDTMAVHADIINNAPDTSSIIVHRLGYLYCCLCDVIREMNNHHGILLVPMMVFFLLHLVITPYNLVSKLFGSAADFYRAAMQIYWAVYHFIDLVMIVEPCHRTLRQMNRTKHLISQMMRITPSDHYALMSELDIFYNYLIMNDVAYAPMKMFRLSRTNIVTVLGSITTYLVIIIQL